MATKYPYVVFSFRVQIDAKELAFTEASGLTTETQVIEHRSGNDKVFSSVKMPGIPKFGNVTLKRGMANEDNIKFLYEWYSQIALNTVPRKTINISMLGASGDPVVTWKILNAWPVKIEGPGFKSTGNEVAIESVELAHEGIEVEYA